LCLPKGHFSEINYTNFGWVENEMSGEISGFILVLYGKRTGIQTENT
jgi:hypothetical protein